MPSAGPLEPATEYDFKFTANVLKIDPEKSWSWAKTGLSLPWNKVYNRSHNREAHDMTSHSYVVCTTTLIAEDRRFQFAASFSSCARPAAVTSAARSPRSVRHRTMAYPRRLLAERRSNEFRNCESSIVDRSLAVRSGAMKQPLGPRQSGLNAVSLHTRYRK